MKKEWQEVKIPKEQILTIIESQVKKEIEKATAMMPTNLKVMKMDWTAEGLTIWTQE